MSCMIWCINIVPLSLAHLSLPVSGYLCVKTAWFINLCFALKTFCFGGFLTNPDKPCRIFCASSSQKKMCSEICAAKVYSIYFLGLKGKFPPSRDTDLAVSALLHCVSFRPVFCLTQHIICKWIFKDLHIYITEFLSHKFSKSAKFCPEYVNLLLVSHSWEHSDGEHVCCWLRSQTLKHFSVSFGSPTNVYFCGGFHFINICDIPSVFLYFSLKACWRVRAVSVSDAVFWWCALIDKWDLYSHYLGCSLAGGMI